MPGLKFIVEKELLSAKGIFLLSSAFFIACSSLMGMREESCCWMWKNVYKRISVWVVGDGL